MLICVALFSGSPQTCAAPEGSTHLPKWRCVEPKVTALRPNMASGNWRRQQCARTAQHRSSRLYLECVSTMGSTTKQPWYHHSTAQCHIDRNRASHGRGSSEFVNKFTPRLSTDAEADRQTDRLKGRQTGRQTDKQTDRQTGRQTAVVFIK